jgi:hypothetical protein
VLFQSHVSTIINSIYNQAQSHADQLRKGDTEKRLSFYHDDQTTYTLEALSKHFTDVTKFTPTHINVTKKIINNLATTYIQDAQRFVIGGSEADQALFDQIAEDASLGIKWKMASRYVKLLKTILLRPVWRYGRIDIDILTGDILDVETGETPEDLKSVMITHFPENGKIEEIEYSLWTASTVKRLDYRGNVISSDINPYQILPFVPVFDYPPCGAFWLEGGDDIISAQEAINQALTDLLYVVRLQGFGQSIIKGAGNSEAPLQVGPATTIELPPEGDFRYESTKAPIKQVVDFIDYIIKQTAIANGLSSSTLATNPTQQSGVSKLVDNSELREMRRSDIALFNVYEKQLYELIKIVWNTHSTGPKLSESSRLKVDFYEVKISSDPLIQSQTWQILLGIGAIGLADVVIERNPDLSREQAIEHLKMIQAEHQSLGIEFPPPPQALNVETPNINKGKQNVRSE